MNLSHTHVPERYMSRKNVPHKLPDGRTIWESRSVATVGAVVALHKGSHFILLCKRGPGCPDEIGKWCMPCGYLDYDETLEECVAREIWEETGIDVNGNEWVLDPNPWRINSRPEGKVQNVSLSYLILSNDEIEILPTPNMENCEDGEVTEHKWCEVSMVPMMDMAFNHDKTIKVLIETRLANR